VTPLSVSHQGHEWKVWQVAVIRGDLALREELNLGGAAPIRDLTGPASALLDWAFSEMEVVQPLGSTAWQAARVPIWLRHLALLGERPLQIGLREHLFHGGVLLLWEGEAPRVLLGVSSQLERR